jgi:DNA-binding PadR family transcriptional regulator
MNRQTFLGEFEMLVLLAVLRLKGDAYGVTILREIEERAGRVVARGALYVTLDRLEQKGYLRSRLADPSPERGGRAKRFYRVERAGIAALQDSRAAISGLWHGLEPIIGEL